MACFDRILPTVQDAINQNQVFRREAIIDRERKPLREQPMEIVNLSVNATVKSDNESMSEKSESMK
jgi:ribosomal protein L14